MFHLFKKVYLDFDNRISMSQDRIICSELYGGTKDLNDLSKVFYGENITSVKSVESLVNRDAPYISYYDLFLTLDNFCNKHNTSVHIYCDMLSYYKFYFIWHKLILQEPDFSTIFNCLKSHMFRQIGILNSRFSERGVKSIKDIDTSLLTEDKARQIWNSIKISKDDFQRMAEFIKQNVQSVGIEYLLASYLYDGRYASELAISMSPLVKKDIEKLLYEVKEMLMLNPLQPILKKVLQFKNGPYDFSNFQNVIADESPAVQILFRKDIWGENNASLFCPSSKGSINFSAFTNSDIELIKKMSNQLLWCIEFIPESSSLQDFMAMEDKPMPDLYFEVDKLDFIRMFRDKDVLLAEEMGKVIEYEIYHQDHFARSFSSTIIQSVNNYLVVHIIKNRENKEILKYFTLG